MDKMKCLFCDCETCYVTNSPAGIHQRTMHYVHCPICGAHGPYANDRIVAEAQWKAALPQTELADTNTQQLQAKIAAFADEVFTRTIDAVSISPTDVVNRLRQLSAM